MTAAAILNAQWSDVSWKDHQDLDKHKNLTFGDISGDTNFYLGKPVIFSGKCGLMRRNFAKC
jgi:hypothetical protein